MSEQTRTEEWILEKKFQIWNIWVTELGIDEDPKLPSESPFSRGDWSGEVVSLDDAEDSFVSEDSLYRVLVSGESAPDWDGESCGIALINDGRWIAWVSSWGPTGSGFSRDAYGGNATIYVANSPEILRQRALGSEGRMLCGIPYQSDLP
jgi:hypothetical protein